MRLEKLVNVLKGVKKGKEERKNTVSSTASSITNVLEAGLQGKYYLNQ